MLTSTYLVAVGVGLLLGDLPHQIAALLVLAVIATPYLLRGRAVARTAWPGAPSPSDRPAGTDVIP
jgi:hypothetical protein